LIGFAHVQQHQASTWAQNSLKFHQLAIVATQSLAILGVLLLTGLEQAPELGLFFCLCMYLLGCLLYLLIITLIFYRFTFLPSTVRRSPHPIGSTWAPWPSPR
jgi:hypothetical protein